MDVGLLFLRVVVGSLFIGHGSQKLFGKFGGGGITGTGAFLAQLGYPNARTMAALAGLTEAGSGALLVIGFLTPFAAAGIIGVMVNAIIAVHARNGMWNQNGGSEYPLVLSMVVAAFAFGGPGAYSIDEAFGLQLAGTAWGLSAILLGLITAAIVAMTRRPVPVTKQQRIEERTPYRAA
jgi:putative oxidoreductase